MNWQTELAGMTLTHPVFNAAGTCKTLRQVKELARSACAAVMVGSITLEPRPGNPGDTCWTGPTYAINSMGLPNQGAGVLQRDNPQND